MDKLVKYRTLIKQLLTHHAELSQQAPPVDLETEVVFDEEHDHYMLFTLGWMEGRVHGTTVHVRLRNGKFWIEDDWLEEGITPDLMAAGVPKEDIVLAFHSPRKRALTEFAVA